jgi:hypothetical protein
MSKPKSKSQTQIKIRIRIDLSKLYDLATRVDESSARLLKSILQYYNISVNKIYAINPDIEQTIVLDVSSDKIVFVDNDIDELLQECENIVEIFDGYETAYACI